MNITEQVRELLLTDDPRVVARIGEGRLFTGECDDCPKPGVIYIETNTPAAHGSAIREDGTFCHPHALDAMNTISWGSDATEIVVTVPASLLAGYGALAA